MISYLLSTILVAPAAPTFTESQVTAASLFKNGYAVVTRMATVPASGEMLIKSPPGGSLGTFWISAPSGVKISEAVYTKVASESIRSATTLDEILLANKGATLTFTMASLKTELTEINARLISSEGSVVILERDGGMQVYPKNWVMAIRTTDKSLIYQIKGQDMIPTLRIKATPGGKVYMLALQRGMTWAPSYNVDITDPKKLILTGKAVILNDLEKINGIELRLITGFPNISYLGFADPMTSGQTVDQFVNGLMALGSGVAAPGGALTQNAMRREGGRGLADGDVFAPFDPSTLGGLQAEDLFFYRQPNVTLSPGDRGYYVLFQAESDYEHVYTLVLPDAAAIGRDPNLRGIPLDVWHELKFKNEAKLPLTTAPAITTQNGEILGQDTLNYLSPGAEGFLKITKALEIAADLEEEETARQRNALEATGYRWDLVTVKGTVEVVNRKSTPVKMRITKVVNGEMLSASDDGKITKMAKTLVAVNMTSRVVYTPELRPGERRQLTYTYNTYVRN